MKRVRIRRWRGAYRYRRSRRTRRKRSTHEKQERTPGGGYGVYGWPCSRCMARTLTRKLQSSRSHHQLDAFAPAREEDLAPACLPNDMTPPRQNGPGRSGVSSSSVAAGIATGGRTSPRTVLVPVPQACLHGLRGCVRRPVPSIPTPEQLAGPSLWSRQTTSVCARTSTTGCGKCATPEGGSNSS